MPQNNANNNVLGCFTGWVEIAIRLGCSLQKLIWLYLKNFFWQQLQSNFTKKITHDSVLTHDVPHSPFIAVKNVLLRALRLPEIFEGKIWLLKGGTPVIVGGLKRHKKTEKEWSKSKHQSPLLSTSFCWKQTFNPSRDNPDDITRVVFSKFVKKIWKAPREPQKTLYSCFHWLSTTPHDEWTDPHV